jgi:uncharacterized protein
VTLAYFDTSAIVKLFVEEDGSDDVSMLWDGADVLATSRVTDSELLAALAAATRARRLDERAHRAVKRRWAEYRVALRFIELTRELALEAGALAEVHALGALDAIHLASATILSDATLVLTSWDERLLAAARNEGIATLPVSPVEPD